MDNRKEKEAIAELTKAIAFKADLHLLHLRAAFHEHIGDVMGALRDCRAALSVDPNHQEMLELHSRVHTQEPWRRRLGQVIIPEVWGPQNKNVKREKNQFFEFSPALSILVTKFCTVICFHFFVNISSNLMRKTSSLKAVSLLHLLFVIYWYNQSLSDSVH